MISNLNSILKKNKNKYKINKPFPHIQLKNIFSVELLDDIVENIFKIKDEYEWFKLCTKGSDFSEFGESVVKLTDYLISDEWLDFLSDLTGIDNLRSDKGWDGAGINFEPRGSHLEPHVDFNHRRGMGWRRINLLLFLSKNWKKEWGGQNELGHMDKDQYVKDKSYNPDFNTVVIFSTSSDSYHAFDLVRCPEDNARILITCYYYSNDMGPHEKKNHTTTYVGWDENRKYKKEYIDRKGTGLGKLE